MMDMEDYKPISEIDHLILTALAIAAEAEQETRNMRQTIERRLDKRLHWNFGEKETADLISRGLIKRHASAGYPRYSLSDKGRAAWETSMRLMLTMWGNSVAEVGKGSSPGRRRLKSSA